MHIIIETEDIGSTLTTHPFLYGAVVRYNIFFVLYNYANYTLSCKDIISSEYIIWFQNLF